MPYELYLRHYDRSGVLKNARIEPLWARYTDSVSGQEPLVFALNLDHAAVETVAEFDIIEVLFRNRELGIIDFSRSFVGIVRNWDIQTDEDGLTFVTFTAPNEKHILSWRHVLWYAGTTNRSRFANVPAETLMKTLIQYNCTGDASVANGRLRDGSLLTGMGIDVVIAADQARGNSLSKAFMGGNVLTILQQLTSQAGGDFSLNWQGGGEWLFDFHEGQLGEDKSSGSDRVLFSISQASRSMASPRLRRIGAGATVAIAGGQGEGDQREVSEVFGDDWSADYDIETFADARSEDSEQSRITSGRQKLNDMRKQENLSFDVLQTSNQFYSPVPVAGRKTYRAGDLVTAVYGGEHVRKIESITAEWRVPQSEDLFRVSVMTREVIVGS